MNNKILLNTFNININNLKENKITDYSFSIDNTFFDLFEEPIIEEGDLKAIIKISKNNNLITADMGIEGGVVLTCDNTLKAFNYNININEKVFFKLSHENKELDLNIYSINTPIINFAQHIYDFIVLSIPMKKLHPSLY